ncbi:Na+/H+ antiporter NhaC [Oscillibacter hominis]|uniref:Na+/H+ antiporter NhaC n=1 Tax=Oscillibacter hominis TaxID=2763056 RepID=A0A7G9B2N1_9FIRM|nr:Na+/H+ antiporter NhaC [Oscillibacter hominis]QNL43812.1 Na+/H+ antiporter NhaC [Oscillibacter hominis]
MVNKRGAKRPEREGSFVSSLVVFLLCVTVILFGVMVLKLDAHIPLVAAIAVSSLYGVFVLRIPYSELEQAMLRSLHDALGAILLLMTIGPLIAAWISCGTVPYIIYLGLGLIAPSWFLVFVALMCAILSAVTGSSWTTVGTIGVAFIGISIGMGISLPLTAGAILCGAYFGDKVSPISDVVVFNSGIAKVPIFHHVKYVLYTTVPAFALSLILFFFLGLQYGGKSLDVSAISAIRNGLAETFHFGPVLWLPMLAVAAGIFLKVPAVPSLWLGTVTGGLISVLLQGAAVRQFLGYLFSGFSIQTGSDSLDTILNRGGMTSMMYIIALVICSMSMAGVFDRTKMLLKVAERLTRITHTRVGLIVTTLVTGIITSFVASDPYIAALIPVKAYEKEYERQGLDRCVLSRTVSDGGICFAPLVPWGSNGVFCSTTLGIAVGAYLPFYLMAFLTPVFSILTAVTGIGIRYVTEAAPKEQEHGPADSVQRQ